MANDGADYSESSIKVLEGTEGVRLRPAMYIGDVGERGLHHLVYEVIDNSIDEAMAGRCSKVDIVIHDDNSISIRDDGAGIPAGMHPEYGVPTLELILTRLHSGGKFEKKAYQVSGGLHGIGLAAVCALSEYFRVESYRNGVKYSQDYSEGIKQDEVSEEPTDQPSGTLIHFKPDSTIFNATRFEFKKLANRFKELSFLTPFFRMNFTDTRSPENKVDTEETKILEGEVNAEGYWTVSYYSEGGIREFVEHLTRQKDDLVEDAPTFYTNSKEDDIIVEIAFKYTRAYSENVHGYVNNINTHEGGTHITGFRAALTKELNDFAREAELLKKDDANLDSGDIREGMTAIVSVKVPEPLFEGQTKTKLGNSEVRSAVQIAFGKALADFLRVPDNKRLTRSIVEKAIAARKAREAAKKARDKVRKETSNRSLPGKLVKCREKDPTKRELFIVEGQSAGGTAVEGRDREFQEVLFMRGKVLNVEKARVDRALKNNEINNIITAVGTSFLDEFDIERIRYGKIVLLTDADVDGAHIATLLFTFFYRYLRPVVEHGFLYIARPPLYKVTPKGKEMRSKFKEIYGREEYIYLHKERDLNVLKKELKDANIDPNGLTVNRFKGLGEMNADQLAETAMDPATRTIEQVTIDDAIEAEEWLIKLMGDDVGARKQYIRDGVFEDDESPKGHFYRIAFKTDEEEKEEDEEPEDIDSKIEDVQDDDLEDFLTEQEEREMKHDTGQILISALENLEEF
ncbi:MAG: DNA gyrase subunit B [Candidatus Kariarchaeaceae archaeon]|jgi:DNA gyrase subunit B